MALYNKNSWFVLRNSQKQRNIRTFLVFSQVHGFHQKSKNLFYFEFVASFGEDAIVKYGHISVVGKFTNSWQTISILYTIYNTSISTRLFDGDKKLIDICKHYKRNFTNDFSVSTRFKRQKNVAGKSW